MENNFYYEIKQEKSDKSYVALCLLSFFLGCLGIDRFYAGRIGLGVCKLLFGWMRMGIWPLVDFILAIAGKQKDSEGKYITQ
ncbi:TM2 domain-containing protein [Mycoplasmopsis gallopavonis]|uniref:TM2 domain n=1 Tax=Mycoplasmopsis gallopavonis TaxID=76629 RepID=A0A449AYV0_9BACT|nr:TM2 domain-containing protein [Mycoplasmopsis gallopavonis]RIV16250.1 TM2 domain-containing protein [Mycoplasmopsis gallopavonis]VEU72626.1 TM2 domain [Mycoplasmopsis gallopavonis]VEU72981.1 TM2 domain [Mycoplasmopsis gallopavonis]